MRSSRGIKLTSKTLGYVVTFAIAFTMVAPTANSQDRTSHRGIPAHRTNVDPVRAPGRSAPKSLPRAAQAKAVSYRVVSLGVLPGKNNTVVAEDPSVINNLGHVAGFSNVFTGEVEDYYVTAQAFLWKNGKLQALPLLQGWPGAFATGVNDLDQVIGEANNFNSDGSRRRIALRWDGGKVVNLGALDSNSDSAALGINVWGTAVGFSSNIDTGQTTPVAWYGGTIHALPLVPGETDGVAFGINDWGVIAGQQSDDDANLLPCLWYWSGNGYTTVSLGNLGGDFGAASDVNDLGQAVGWTLYAGDLHGPAFVWKGHGLQALPTLPGDTDGYANAINEFGQIVGFSLLFDDDGNLLSQRVVIWQNGTVTDLQTLVPANTPTFTDIGNVNLQGQIAIEAGSFDDGSLAGYVLIPEGH